MWGSRWWMSLWSRLQHLLFTPQRPEPGRLGAGECPPMHRSKWGTRGRGASLDPQNHDRRMG